MTWAIAVVSLLGTVLNIYKRRVCFLLWGATNAAWAVVDYTHGLEAQAALMVIYFALSVWGFFRWETT